MKKSSIWVLFIIIAIIAMIATSSLMDGLGFALTVVIVIFSLMCIIGAIFLVYTAYENIKNKYVSDAIGDLVLFLILFFVSIKILKWLIGVLSWSFPPTAVIAVGIFILL